MTEHQLVTDGQTPGHITDNRKKGLKQGSVVADKTCAMCCSTANVLQTNKVDAQCDKLATELS